MSHLCPMSRRRFLETLSLYERQGTREGPEAEVESVTFTGCDLRFSRSKEGKLSPLGLVREKGKVAPKKKEGKEAAGKGGPAPFRYRVKSIAGTGFAVTFTLPRFQPVTVPVQVIRNPGDFTSPATTTVEPSPVFAELKPAAPPPKVRKPMRPKPKT